MATAIKTSLAYAKDDKSRPYFYSYVRSDEERKATPQHEFDFGGTNSTIDVTVNDARLEKICLDINSFELVEQTTSLSTDDFYNNPEKIIEVYYKEIGDTIKKVTGAAHVQMFHHQVRNEEKNTGRLHNLNTSVQGYAMGIHSDSHPQAAEEVFKSMADKEHRKGRFLYINAWRNISDTPIGNNHLAVCDESSLVKPDDYLTTDLFMGPGGGHIQQYRLLDRNANQHRWYYYSKMKKDEVLLFKQFDSDTTLSGRVCFHTAFKDDSAPSDAPTRESIEARGIAFFPDHEPNTCPPIEEVGEEDGLIGDDDVIQNGITKVLEALEALQMWPPFAILWLKGRYAKGEEGYKQIAEALCKDTTGALGLKNLNSETKAKIVSEIMKGDKFRQRLEVNMEKLGKVSVWSKYGSALSKVLTLIVGGVIGWVLCTVLTQNIQEQEL